MPNIFTALITAACAWRCLILIPPVNKSILLALSLSCAAVCFLVLAGIDLFDLHNLPFYSAQNLLQDICSDTELPGLACSFVSHKHLGLILFAAAMVVLLVVGWRTRSMAIRLFAKTSLRKPTTPLFEPLSVQASLPFGALGLGLYIIGAGFLEHIGNQISAAQFSSFDPLFAVTNSSEELCEMLGMIYILQGILYLQRKNDVSDNHDGPKAPRKPPGT